MKKTVAIVIALVLVVCVFAACNNETQASQPEVQEEITEEAVVPEEAEETLQEETAAEAVKNYLYQTAEGVAIDIMDAADPVLEKLGDPISSFEADSCAFQGKDLFYYYDGYQLTVNAVDGENKITAITLVDDTVATPEGLKIGDDESMIEELYGEDYEKDGSIYVYADSAKDGSAAQLRIKADNGKVSGITFVCVTEGNEE